MTSHSTEKLRYISCRIFEDTFEKLKKLSKAEGVSYQAILRNILKDGVDQRLKRGVG